jgi:tetratricopeptide (TPR) repeat protein
MNAATGPHGSDGISAAVERICASEGFRRSARLQRFLRYLASAQSANGHGPKEYEVAREVYDKPVDFNPQTDPIVRVEASRLRLRIGEYYQRYGASDDLVLELPRGSYSLRYRSRHHASAQPDSTGNRQHYLRGRYLWNKRTTESLGQAIECFQQAIDEDCLNAAAWSGLADCYNVLGTFELMHPQAVFPRAIAASRKALELNPDLAEAHTSLATAVAVYQWEAARAFEGFERAIAIDPEYASAWHFYGVVLFGRGLYDRAMQALERAHALDPLAPIIRVQVASLHYLMRRYREADRVCDEVIRLHPAFWPAHWFAGMSLEQQGLHSEAHRRLETAVQVSDRSPLCVAALGHLAGVRGCTDLAAGIAQELERRRRDQYSPATAIALVYLGRGDIKAALRWLEIACEERSPFLAMSLWGDPRLDPIRNEPRFLCIIKALGV